MGTEPPASEAAGLAARLEEVGRRLGEREAEHSEALSFARERARELRAEVAQGLDAFHVGARASGAPHLHVELGELRLDDKHARAMQFDLRRGRHQAIVTVKSRGEVSLVGPFRTGKTEGPCQRFPIDAKEEMRKALAGFLERFLEEASSP